MSNEKPVRRLVQRERILIALYHASNGSTARVAYEELVIQAWTDFRKEFSLRNHPEYPESSDVHKQLYNDSYNIKEGLAVALGNKNWRLTDKGVATAEQLIKELSGQQPSQVPQAQESTNEKGRLDRPAKNFIDHALKARALVNWRAGQQDKLVDYDVRTFFQFTSGTKVDDRKKKVKNAQGWIDHAKAIGIPGADDLQALAALLTENFGHLFKEI